MAVLNAAGVLVGEYWNVGYLQYPIFQDLNRDGREELIVFGVNNQYKGGALIVFDASRIKGASPQSGKWICEGLEPGSELYYVTVPFTDVSKARGQVVAGFASAFITNNDRIKANYEPSLFYEFDFDLRCVQVTWGHGYINCHADGVRNGKITSVLDESYARMLLDGIRYWNGSAWVGTPTMVKR